MILIHLLYSSYFLFLCLPSSDFPVCIVCVHVGMCMSVSVSLYYSLTVSEDGEMLWMWICIDGKLVNHLCTL